MNGTSHQQSATKITFLVLLCALLCFLFLPHKAGAVTVGPVKLEYSTDPGKTLTGNLFIKNEERVTKTFYPSVDEFTEVNGEKAFLKEKGLIEEWLTTVPSVTLKPDESQEVPYTINIPKNAPPGGQFAVIWWSTNPPVNSTSSESQPQLSIETRAGVLVYLNISGNIVEQASIPSFDTEKSKSIFGTAKVPFYITMANEGNVYIKPKGSVKVRSIFGHIVEELPLNPKGLQILPKSKRVLTDAVWTGSLLTIGPYKAEVTAQYGASQKEIIATKWVWVLPWVLIVSVVGGLIILFILFTIFFRMYNRWLLNKYTNRGEN